MSFRMIEIVDTKPEGLVAKMSYQDQQLTVIIPNRGKDDLAAGTSFQTNVAFDRILDWQIIDSFDDAKSGIWQAEDGVHLLGRVHSVLDYGDGKTVIDVYIRNGSEIFQIDSEAIEDADLEANSGLEIIVGNLYVYPTDP